MKQKVSNFFKHFFDFVNSVSVTTNTTTVIVNNKKIDPESPEGKKILEDTAKITEAFDKAGKMMEDAFRNL